MITQMAAITTTTTRRSNGTGALRRTRAFNPRPFYATILIFSCLAVYSLVFKSSSTYTSASTWASTFTPARHRHDRRSLLDSSAHDCRLIRDAPDKCAFVKLNCHDEEAGLFEYLTFYYCSLGHVQPLAFIILVLWLGLLFSTIGIAASDFFSVNLSTISTFLGLSESLAGVTFLAFGNGSPDVFSTFAAMSSNSGSMAIGELIGAAGFITTVVAGSMALVREFRVARKTFVRDICFFIVAVGFAVGFLFDGQLHFAECLFMIGFYLFYVAVVVGWHAVTKRRNARRAKEAASRAHFYRATSDHDNDELEPYRDAPDDDDELSSSVGRLSAPIDIEALERTPLIEVGNADEDRDDESDRNQHVAAEVTSSMRVNRPRGRRSNTTITPIRPSLVGALEFRSVLASLQKEGNVRMRPINPRIHSTGHPRVDSHLGHQEQPSPLLDIDHDTTVQATRSRALSSGDVPATIDSDIAEPSLVDEEIRSHGLHIIGVTNAFIASTTYTESPQQREIVTATVSFSWVYRFASCDDPNYATAIVPKSSIPCRRPSFAGFELNGAFGSKAREVVALQDLTPTTHNAKHPLPNPTGMADEAETADDDIDDIADQSSLVHLHAVPSVAVESGEPIEQETEWQRYRRSTLSSRATSRSPSPSRTNLDGSQITVTDADTSAAPIPPTIQVQPPKPPSDLGHDASTVVEEDQGWNRWLLILQIFIGPLFCVLVVWANLAEDLENPIKVLARALLISLVCSLVLLAVLLTTTSPDRRPKYHVAFCFLGFVIAIAWISTVAGEVVGVMKAFGVILDISEAILGLTIFAVGNSVGDLVADVTVARLGYPVMALSACFGGPLLNILLGIGLGGAYQTIHTANKHHIKHPDEPYRYLPYHIQVTATLVVSTLALLMTLFALLVVVPMNKWMMTKKIGWGLIVLWTVSTVTNLAIEITGVWQDVA
ncbi:hypothetical protein GQX73_g1278 [Xylaria multiplex]|uniref:Sodium/calcium exchanger membrane region domain-containing protein n=1 Tax=Xylaria multiplex TaxID=323545 RepID=A0A7C8NCT6_9PEZI|nr:hypothetical protein GQX73_g1278 [Xylaria multiplex]